VVSLSTNWTDDGATSWLKVADTDAVGDTPVAPDGGLVEETAGAGGAAKVVKLHVYGAAIVWPVELVAPLTVAV
jgi:hypothetical protein